MLIRRAAFVFFCLLLSACESARILCTFVTPSISHQIVFRAITKELAKRGHELVIMTTDPVNSSDKIYENVTEIDVHDVSYEIFIRNINMAALRGGGNTRNVFLPMFLLSLHEIFDAQIQHPQMQKLLNDPNEKFDLLITEIFTVSTYGFGHKFKVPVIGVGSLPGTVNTWESTGNPTHPLVYYDVLASFVGSMTFLERLESLYGYLWYKREYHYNIQKQFDDQAKRIFGPDTPHVHDLEQNIDMLFINAFPAITGIRPVTAATIYLGGLHLKPKKAIPADIKQYLDNSKQGVIYFSLGSNVKSNQLPTERRQVLIDALGELPYNVMWKYEDDTLPNKPKNILISKWFPQFDMLDHPNIKLFVTQGGQQSLEEAVICGVPMVGIPFIGDQDKNVKTIVDKEIGLYIEISSVTKESFKNAIQEVINNKKYKRNVVELSKIINDDPMTPAERAVWWTEYVLRHNGAKHLRSPVLDLPLYQYYFLDIIGVVLVIVLVGVFILHRLLRILLSLTNVNKLKSA